MLPRSRPERTRGRIIMERQPQAANITQVDQRLESERVIVQAPLSLAGSTQRMLRWHEPGRLLAWKHTHGSETVTDSEGVPAIMYESISGLRTAGSITVNILTALLIPIMLVVAWALVLAWYCLFGLALVPYRLIRRSDRNRKRDALQHREVLAAAIAAQSQASFEHASSERTQDN
jgi:hypothetical protein